MFKWLRQWNPWYLRKRIKQLDLIISGYKTYNEALSGYYIKEIDKLNQCKVGKTRK